MNSGVMSHLEEFGEEAEHMDDVSFRVIRDDLVEQ